MSARARGKSPAIIDPAFPLDTAVERILFAKHLNAGQICTNVDYLFLPGDRVQTFVEEARRICLQLLEENPIPSDLPECLAIGGARNSDTDGV